MFLSFSIQKSHYKTAAGFWNSQGSGQNYMQQNEVLTLNSHFFLYFHLKIWGVYQSVTSVLISNYVYYLFLLQISLKHLTYNSRTPNIPDRDKLKSPLFKYIPLYLSVEQTLSSWSFSLRYVVSASVRFSESDRFSRNLVPAQGLPVIGSMTFPTLKTISASSCFTCLLLRSGKAFRRTMSPTTHCCNGSWAK